MPNVATKGGTRRFVTKTPLPAPISAPSASEMSIAGKTISSRPLVTSATTIEVMMKMPPMERSSPATSRIMVWPMATMPQLRGLAHDHRDRIDFE